MTIDAGGGLCVVHIPPFTGKSYATVSNSHPHINVELAVGGITATLTDTGGFFCPFSGHTHVTNGTLTSGNITVVGANGATIDIG
jgi:hypothetical protein